jgi:dipeptidyl aminopeptidase/acylaminoacyl peptidase
MRPRILTLLLCACASTHAQNKPSFDPAAAFGARASVQDLSLSPDGNRVAYITPGKGQGSALITLSLDKDATGTVALQADGKPYRLDECVWISAERLACEVFATSRIDSGELAGFTRLIAVNFDGTNLRVLSTQTNDRSHAAEFNGGHIIDSLADGNDEVLMTRTYVPDTQLGTRAGSSAEGLAVDDIDTRDVTVKHIERANPDAFAYLSDGYGSVRIMGVRVHQGDGYETGIVRYSYREQGSRSWKPLSTFNRLDGSGFWPIAVDHDLNVVYGFKKQDGKRAVFSITLDDALHEQLVYARPDVDVDGLIRIGRRAKVVGINYSTEESHAFYLDADIQHLMTSLSKALHDKYALTVVDATSDNNKLLLFASSDTDPGVYYLFDRKSHELRTFLVARNALEGAQLASVKPVSYPSSDGTQIPAYLTLPPGQESAKGLPAIVLPHGGPSERDQWGFDWLPQFFAARGYAVLQPNYRGSGGYGDVWLQKNGFRSWPVAIGDVLAAGRWLVNQGIADPSKLAIVGWSYGGYAALQSATMPDNVYKAVVAIAPVTDLGALKEESRFWSDFYLTSEFIGRGPVTRDGSPLARAADIKVPVLLFHGSLDTNVHIGQSQRMAKRLEALGKPCKLMTWEGLDHQLDDSEARTQMLRTADAFLQQWLGQRAAEMPSASASDSR